MKFFKQLGLLLKKNYLIRRRQKLWLVVELLSPLALFAILVLVRTRDLTQDYPTCHYDAKALPGAGILPFLQSLFCTMSNKCNSHPTSGDDRTVIQTEKESSVVTVFRDLVSLLDVTGTAYELIEKLSWDMADVVKLLADLQEAQPDQPIPIHTLFSDPERAIVALTSCELTERAAERFMDSDLKPSSGRVLARVLLKNVGGVEGIPAVADFGDFEGTLLLLDEIWKGIFCNEANLREAFYSKDYKLLGQMCKVEPLCLAGYIIAGGNYFNFTAIYEAGAMMVRNVTGKQIDAATGVQLVSDFLNIQSTWNDPKLRPVVDQISNLSAIFSTDSNMNPSQMLNQLTCGQFGDMVQRYDDSTRLIRRVINNATKPSQNSPTSTTSSTQNNSKETGQKQAPETHFCGKINTTESRNFCLRGRGDSLLLYGLRSFDEILRGYILVSPDSPVVREVVEKLRRPFETLNDLRLTLRDFQRNAVYYQRQLAKSTLSKAIHNVLDMVTLFNTTVYRLPVNATMVKRIKDLIRDSGSTPALFPELAYYTADISMYLKCIRTENRFVILSDESTVEEVGVCLEQHNLYFSGIVFTNLTNDSTTLNDLTVYKIRMDPNRVDGTRSIRDSLANKHHRNNPFRDLKYLTYGFSFLQDMVDRAIIEVQTNKSTPVGVYGQQFPGPCYKTDVFYRMLPSWTPFLMVMSWVLPYALVVKNIVYEKEKRLKEVMKVMGLGNLVHWLAWAIQSISIGCISILVMILMLKFGDILPYTDWTVLLVFLLLYITATVTQAFAVSTIFNQANLAAAVACIFYVALYFPYGLLRRRMRHEGTKVALCLMAQTALGWGIKSISDYEQEQIGLSWSTINKSVDKSDPFTFLTAMLMLIVDIVIHILITWYIEAVFPGQYGIPRPFYFPFQKSYWCGEKAKSVIHEVSPLQKEYPEADFEAEPGHLRAGVCIENLRKVYSNGNVAVDDLSVKFYETQITSFLGHNGAGKTTTLSVLCGLFPASSGSVTVYDMDIQTQVDEIRKSLGFCPQHNVLFDILGVEEQLHFYAGLKGVKPGHVKQEIEKILKDVGLYDKGKELAKNLSGGMQRKLSIAIAFIGSCRTVILDEPTAGVDPYARRAIWDLLLKYKQGRTIILSTHHMDEADLLGDRIAIVVDGKLRCCGSSLFLRNRFGSGYRLTIVRDPHAFDPKLVNTSEPASPLPDVVPSRLPSLEVNGALGGTSPVRRPLPPVACDEQQKRAIKTMLSKAMPQCRCIEAVGADMVFSLPRGDPAKLKDFFIKLDEQQELLGITSYGISDTTLEEIFLKTVVAQREDHLKTVDECCECCPALNRLLRVDALWKRAKNKLNIGKERSLSPDREDRNLVDSSEEDSPDEASCLLAQPDEELDAEPQSERVPHPDVTQITNPWQLTLQRLKALVIKRFHNWKRNKKGAFCELFLPVVVVALAMFLIQNVLPPPRPNEPGLFILQSMYASNEGDNQYNYVFYGLENKENTSKASEILEALSEPPGMGIRCMDEEPSGQPCLSVESKWLYPDGHRPFNYSVNNNGCVCNISDWMCSSDSYKPRPSLRLTNTSDYLVDMTGRNVSQWILMTFDKYQINRYGGFQIGQIQPKALTPERVETLEDDVEKLSDLFLSVFQNLSIDLQNPIPHNYSTLQMVDSVIKGLETKETVKVWFFNKGWASFPAYVNTINNALLRMMLPEEKRRDYGILLINHPMSYTPEEKQASEAMQNTVQEIFFVILIILAFSTVPASFVLFLIDERVTHSKHLQFVSGIQPRLYWMANFLWDMVNFMIPVILVIIIFYIFDAVTYTRSLYETTAVFLLLVLYGFAIIPLMYIFTFIFSVPPWAFVILIVGNLLIGMISTVAAAILRNVSQQLDDPVLTSASRICDKAFLLFPHFCMGDGLLDMNIRNYEVEMGVEWVGMSKRDLFSWPVLGNKYCWLILQGIVCFAVVLIVEYRHRVFKYCNSGKKTIPAIDQSEDDDVIAERQKVEMAPADQFGLLVKNLTKLYSGQKLPAVDGVTIGVNRGACFGLLGLNGAGKTTIFKMITGKIPITKGDGVINGLSVRHAMRRLYQVVGYCPQFDALNAHLTGREQLAFYARIRGILESDITKVVDWAIRHMHLTIYQNNATGTYSGGNKRKLSTAIALVGNPLVVLLDEPSTGMDPKTRRFMWNRIIELTRDNHTVVLTTHSMEECEALCTRVGIMVAGRLKCIGSVQHLKKKFGEGYRLTIKLRALDPDDQATRIVQEELPRAKLEDKHFLTLEYRLPAGNITVSEAFAAVERLKSRLDIEDYALSQTTLDDVFVSFASKHSTPDEHKSKKKKKKKSKSIDIPLNDRNVGESPNDVKDTVVLPASAPASARAALDGRVNEVVRL